MSDERCRMCLSDYPDMACPECGACFVCASDDCAVCLVRLDFLQLEQGLTPLHGTGLVYPKPERA